MTLKEEKLYRAKATKIFGCRAYAIALNMECDLAEKEGRPRPSTGEVCKKMLETIKTKRVKKLETATITSTSQRKVAEAITRELNYVMKSHPELRIVSPIQYTNNFLDVTGSVTYEIEVIEPVTPINKLW